MRIGKLCLAAFLGALPAVAVAQPSIDVRVGVDVDDRYDSAAPGDSVETVDVFYDQLSPYGAWVDEPDVGRVFIPETPNYVPYTVGHWEYTSLGFVWVSSESYGWATSHYGRWAFSNNYGRWYWLPDTEWGPAWVEWRQTGSDFGWAPLAPDVVIRAGWQPPVESWHYCGAEHVLDANVSRYYEPRTRVVEIHREARPIEHYARIGNVRAVVGPPAATLRERHVTARPVKVEAHAIGRWTPTEVHTQVARAQEHRATFEVQNQHRIESNPQIHAAHVKVVDAHPQIKAQVDARVSGRVEANHLPQPTRLEPNHPPQPTRVEPNHPAQPTRVEPNHPAGPQRVEPNRPAQPTRVEPNRPEPARPSEPVRPAQPVHVEPNRPQPSRPAGPARPAPPQHVEPVRPAAPPPPRAEPPHPAPAAPPPHAEPAHPAPAAPPPPHGNDKKEH